MEPSSGARLLSIILQDRVRKKELPKIMGLKFMSLFFPNSCGNPMLGVRLQLRSSFLDFKKFSKIRVAPPD